MDLEAAFGALPGLTERSAQRRMAAAVAEALEAQAPLLVHAPTGVGKSLGSLVPIVAAGRRAIVATATKALQSQLVERDLPRLADAFGTTSALAMGRANYACYARMEALVGATQLAATATEEAALEVAVWAADSATGSRLDAPPGVRDDVWDLVSTSGEDCPGQKGCAFHHRCFAERAREQAREVDVVVTNHHLLLLELELRAMADAPGVMLPEVDVVVVDEAHRLADHAADLYGVTVTATRMGRAGAAADAAAKAAGLRTDWARRLRGRFQELAADVPPGPTWRSGSRRGGAAAGWCARPWSSRGRCWRRCCGAGCRRRWPARPRWPWPAASSWPAAPSGWTTRRPWSRPPRSTSGATPCCMCPGPSPNPPRPGSRPRPSASWPPWSTPPAAGPWSSAPPGGRSSRSPPPWPTSPMSCWSRATTPRPGWPPASATRWPACWWPPGPSSRASTCPARASRCWCWTGCRSPGPTIPCWPSAGGGSRPPGRPASPRSGCRPRPSPRSRRSAA